MDPLCRIEVSQSRSVKEPGMSSSAPSDFFSEVEYYQKAVDNNEVDAMVKLGECYANGRGVPKDLEKAVALYQRASAMDNKNGMHKLAVCYKNGKGVPQDEDKAAAWFKLSHGAGRNISGFSDKVKFASQLLWA